MLAALRFTWIWISSTLIADQLFLPGYPSWLFHLLQRHPRSTHPSLDLSFGFGRVGGVPRGQAGVLWPSPVVCFSCEGRHCSVTTGMCHMSDCFKHGCGGHMVSLNAPPMLPGHTPPRPLPLPGVSYAGVSTGNRESVSFFTNFQEFLGSLLSKRRTEPFLWITWWRQS